MSLSICRHLAFIVEDILVSLRYSGSEARVVNFAEDATTETLAQDPTPAFDPSPSALLDITSDLDFGLDFSSLETEIAQATETFESQAALDFNTLDPSFDQPPEYHSTSEESNQEHEGEIISGPQDPCSLPPTTSTTLPHTSDATSSELKTQERQIKDSTLHGTKLSSQSEMHSKNANLHDEEKDSNRNRDHGSSGDGFSPMPTSAGCHRLVGKDSSSLERKCVPRTVSSPEFMVPWIRRLSELNVELHQHMLSIPLAQVEPIVWQDQASPEVPQGSKAVSYSQQLPVDRTLQLSQTYAEILADALSMPKDLQANGVHSPILKLDQSSQLLVLSSCICLADSYNKILLHIKGWTTLQPKTGPSMSHEHYQLQLPPLAIGEFRLPVSSLACSLVLTCIIETAVMQMHGTVSHVINLAANRISSQGSSTGPPSLINTVCNVAEVTQQAIAIQEEVTMELVQDIWQLATRCQRSQGMI
ncbi:hypothetical protein GQ44DRAFT_767831 [Phaeosphaeriaceae sp. PMI808]|nr:hypothetical protein GQ44DRAFT_767831 [Phaeosphaeriaceae sp. PMI808]